MNELFFSALIIGNLFFGSSQDQEENTELNISHQEMEESNYKGTTDLIENGIKNFTFKTVGDEYPDRLIIYVNEERQGETYVGNEFSINKPKDITKDKYLEVLLKYYDKGQLKTYSKDVVSF